MLLYRAARIETGRNTMKKLFGRLAASLLT